MWTHQCVDDAALLFSFIIYVHHELQVHSNTTPENVENSLHRKYTAIHEYLDAEHEPPVLHDVSLETT